MPLPFAYTITTNPGADSLKAGAEKWNANFLMLQSELLPAISTALAGRSLVGHTHTIADVTGLQTALTAASSVDHPAFRRRVWEIHTDFDGDANTDAMLIPQGFRLTASDGNQTFGQLGNDASGIGAIVPTAGGSGATPRWLAIRAATLPPFVTLPGLKVTCQARWRVLSSGHAYSRWYFGLTSNIGSGAIGNHAIGIEKPYGPGTGTVSYRAFSKTGSNSEYQTTTLGVITGDWVTAEITWDGTATTPAIRFLLNGQLRATISTPAVIPNTANPLIPALWVPDLAGDFTTSGPKPLVDIDGLRFVVEYQADRLGVTAPPPFPVEPGSPPPPVSPPPPPPPSSPPPPPPPPPPFIEEGM